MKKDFMARFVPMALNGFGWFCLFCVMIYLIAALHALISSQSFESEVNPVDLMWYGLGAMGLARVIKLLEERQ